MFLLSSYWVLYCALCYSSFGDAVLSDKDCENVYELVYSSHRQVQCSLLLYFFNNTSSVVSKWLITSQLYMYVTSYQGAIFKISLTLELLFTIKSHFIIKIKLSWWPIFMIQHACFGGTMFWQIAANTIYCAQLTVESIQATYIVYKYICLLWNDYNWVTRCNLLPNIFMPDGHQTIHNPL